MFELFKVGRFKEHKKGSLEISINAIIIVVLAMTLLGLGLTFIRGMFKKITETTGTVQEQVKDQILADLRTGDKKLSFPSTNINLDRGSTNTLAFGVKNTKGLGTLNFEIDIDVTGAKTSNFTGDEIGFFYDAGPFSLSPADSDVYAFQISDVANAVEVYKIKIIINEILGEDVNATRRVYAEKTFFLNVG